MDIHYYVSSQEIDPGQTAKAFRQHWHTENQQHWVLDMTYREDVSRIGSRGLCPVLPDSPEYGEASSQADEQKTEN